MCAPSPIFVAGTGRSGTSQFADILGEHPQIHRIPIETHFIVDPGGLRDLADALTIRYDPYVGDDALRRLSAMLTVRLVGRRDRDRGYTVPAAIGERHYWDALGRLWSELVASTFDESVPAAGFGHADWPAGPFEPQSYRRAVPRYFSDRRELLENPSSRSRHDVRRSSCRRGIADLEREDTVQPSVHGLPLGARP
jgi:omega-hydroxy-beta-dihydromenaquinone-9 sulfotransferase